MKKEKKETCSRCGSTENVVLGNCEKCGSLMIEKLFGVLKKLGVADEFQVESLYVPKLKKNCRYLKVDLSEYLAKSDKH